MDAHREEIRPFFEQTYGKGKRELVWGLLSYLLRVLRGALGLPRGQGVDHLALSFSKALQLGRAAIIVLCFLTGCAAITPPPPGEKIVRDLVYARRPTGPEHLDIYLPAGSGPFPVVV